MACLSTERDHNRRATVLLDRLGIRLDPRIRVGELTVAKQMVEITKALSFDSQVLIMDEPTAALNDAEIATLHDLIRRFTTERTGVIYISHRMDELKAITDRITVIRDGEFVQTMDTAATSVAEVVSLMVGRGLVDDARPVGVRDDREVVLSVRGLSTKKMLKDVSFGFDAARSWDRHGPTGAGRTEAARALVGADRKTGQVEASTAAVCRCATRRRRPGTASATCPRTASTWVCCSRRTSAPTSRCRRWATGSAVRAGCARARSGRPPATSSRACASRRRQRTS